ncbi:MAG: tetratricopeptide repeat protein, partial [Acidisphaera sp.]|nr:tetratricopeptide repeat protein [Acidisphaera sp.]
LAEVEIPASVQGVLASRIDRLSPPRRGLLQLASVIGKDVPLSLLRSVSGMGERALQAELAGLCAGEFLYEIDLPLGTEYTFKHALTRAVAYEGMLRRNRRELHGRVLAALEVDEAVIPEHLAHHALHGEVWDRAAVHAQQAGLRANARSAWREAIAFFEMALEALAHLPDEPEHRRRAIEVRLGLRVPLGPLGEFGRSAQHLQEARAIAAALGDERRLGPIDTNICLMFTNLGRLQEAIEAGQHSLALATRLEDAPGRLSASYALGQAHWFSGNLAEAERVLAAALPSLRGELRLRDTGTTGTASVLTLVCLSKTYATIGRDAEAAAAAAEARVIAQETRRPYDLSYADIAEGYARLLRGEDAAAVPPLEQALREARAAEIALLVPSIARYLGRAYAAIGRHEAAEALLEEALDLTRAQGLVGLTAWCNLALAHARLARQLDVGPVLEEALALAERHGYRPVMAQVHRLLARLHAEAGRPREAAAAQQAASRLAEMLGMRPETARRKFPVSAAAGIAGLPGPAGGAIVPAAERRGA